MNISGLCGCLRTVHVPSKSDFKVQRQFVIAAQGDSERVRELNIFQPNSLCSILELIFKKRE